MSREVDTIGVVGVPSSSPNGSMFEASLGVVVHSTTAEDGSRVDLG